MLFSSGSLGCRGCASLTQFSKAVWLRSNMMILSSMTASLDFNDSFQCDGFAPQVRFSQSEWLRSQNGYARRLRFSHQPRLRSYNPGLFILSVSLSSFVSFRSSTALAVPPIRCKVNLPLSRLIRSKLRPLPLGCAGKSCFVASCVAARCRSFPLLLASAFGS